MINGVHTCLPLARRIKIIRWLTLCAVMVSAQLSYAQTASSPQYQIRKEYQVKAVFLFNFSQFVEWKPTTFAGPDAPFVIGILGEDPFGSYINETVEGEKMMGHPIIVQRFADINDIPDCHILYINIPGAPVREVIQSLERRNILTVSDADDFLLSGGIVRFTTEKGKIKFQINLSAAKQAELTISSKLLRLAQVVK